MISANIAYLFIILFVTSPIECKSRDQTFNANSNYDNPDRWSGHEVPCAGDKINFNPDQAVSVFVQTNASITEIVLPLNGEFIFADDVIWGLSPELSTCHGHDDHVVNYISDTSLWMDTSAWKASVDGNQLSNQDLLDTEQVPCQSDQVYFEEDSSWIVSIPVDVSVMSLSLWNKQYTTQTFAEYRATDSGNYQFQGQGSLALTENNCNDLTGCVCRNEEKYQESLDLICNAKTCPPFSCENPLLPVAHCCYICGAVLSLSYDVTYTEDSLWDYITQLLQSGQYDNVHPILTKVAPYMETDVAGLRSTQERLQVTITDESSGTNSGSYAKQFAQDLLNAVQNPSNNLGITNATMKVSGQGISPQTGLSAGSIVGIVIGVLLAIVLIIVAISFLIRSGGHYKFPSYKNFPTSNKFGNIENPLYDITTGVEELEPSDITTSPSVTGLPSSKIPSALKSDFGVTFDNPLYEEEDV